MLCINRARPGAGWRSGLFLDRATPRFTSDYPFARQDRRLVPHDWATLSPQGRSQCDARCRSATGARGSARCLPARHASCSARPHLVRESVVTSPKQGSGAGHALSCRSLEDAQYSFSAYLGLLRQDSFASIARRASRAGGRTSSQPRAKTIPLARWPAEVFDDCLHMIGGLWPLGLSTPKQLSEALLVLTTEV